MYLPLSCSSSESQENAASNTPSCCQCHRPITPCYDSAICDSVLSAASHDQESMSRIAEMEAELSKLRHQLAMLVMAQESGKDGNFLVLEILQLKCCSDAIQRAYCRKPYCHVHHFIRQH